LPAWWPLPRSRHQGLRRESCRRCLDRQPRRSERRPTRPRPSRPRGTSSTDAYYAQRSLSKRSQDGQFTSIWVCLPVDNLGHVTLVHTCEAPTERRRRSCEAGAWPAGHDVPGQKSLEETCDRDTRRCRHESIGRQGHLPETVMGACSDTLEPASTRREIAFRGPYHRCVWYGPRNISSPSGCALARQATGIGSFRAVGRRAPRDLSVLRQPRTRPSARQ